MACRTKRRPGKHPAKARSLYQAYWDCGILSPLHKDDLSRLVYFFLFSPSIDARSFFIFPLLCSVEPSGGRASQQIVLFLDFICGWEFQGYGQGEDDAGPEHGLRRCMPREKGIIGRLARVVWWSLKSSSMCIAAFIVGCWLTSNVSCPGGSSGDTIAANRSLFWAQPQPYDSETHHADTR